MLCAQKFEHKKKRSLDHSCCRVDLTADRHYSGLSWCRVSPPYQTQSVYHHRSELPVVLHTPRLVILADLVSYHLHQQ